MNGLVFTNPENPNNLAQAGTNTGNTYKASPTGTMGAIGMTTNAYTDLATGLTGLPHTLNPFQANTGTDQHPIQSANGMWVSSSTGEPWHGAYQNPNGMTQYYSNGVQVSDVGQVGNQTPNISVQQIQKDPAVSSQVSSAINQNAGNSSLLSKSFSQYLDEANQIASGIPQQEQQAVSAINPSGTISRVNADVNTSGTKLDSTLNQYETAQNQNQANIAGANQAYQTNQDSALASLGSNLNTEQNNYETAAQNVAGQAYANALKQINLYQLTSGTPASGSGALDNRYIGAYNNINLPLQQQLAQMRMGTTNQLYNLGSNLRGQYLQNLQSQFAGQGALNSDIASRSTSANQYLTGLDQNTAQYVQGLQQQVAQMQPQVALQYLQAIGVPMQTAQAIISGNTQNLSQLAGLDQSANFYNLYGNANYQGPSFTSPRVSVPGLSGNAGAQTTTGSLLDSGSIPWSNPNDYLSALGGQPQAAAPRTATAPARDYTGYGPSGNYTSIGGGVYADPSGNNYQIVNGQWEPALGGNGGQFN